MKLHYVVEAGYMDFTFTKSIDAMTFAQMAAQARTDGDHYAVIKIYDMDGLEKERADNLKAAAEKAAEEAEKELTAQEQRDQDYLFTDEV